MAKIFSQAQMDEIYAYFKNKMNSLSVIKYVPKPFAECTWDEIISTLALYYNGTVSLSCIKEGWKIGDSNNITISAMDSMPDYTGSNEQTKSYTIIGIDHDDLVEPINGISKACITLAVTDVLTNAGFMENNSSYSYNYYAGPCRRWVVNRFEPALPTIIKDNMKLVTKVMADTTFNDKAFVPSRTEYTGEGSEGTQYAYYEDIDNRKKSAQSWTRTQKTSCVFYALRTDGTVTEQGMAQYNLCTAFCL